MATQNRGRSRAGMRTRWRKFGTLYNAADIELETEQLRDDLAELGFAPDSRLSEREAAQLGGACPWEPPSTEEAAA